MTRRIGKDTATPFIKRLKICEVCGKNCKQEYKKMTNFNLTEEEVKRFL